MSLPKCMFCTEDIQRQELTREHPAPRALWEKRRRPSSIRTLPAHRACNQSFSDDNEYFRDVLVMEAGAERHPEVERLRAGAMARKFEKRFGSIVKLLKNVGVRNVRTRSGIELGPHPTFEVDRTRIERVLINVLKGVCYLSQQKPLPKHFLISVKDVGSVDAEWLARVVSFMCPWQGFGDTVFKCRYVVSSGRHIEKMTCLMCFYERRFYIGEAIDPKLLGGGGKLFVPAMKGASIVVPRWAAHRVPSQDPAV